jgi:hypothetical protein
VVQDLVSDDAHHFEALLAADGVDDHVAVDADEVLGVENAVLVLAGGVDHLDGEVVIAVGMWTSLAVEGCVSRLVKEPGIRYASRP